MSFINNYEYLFESKNINFNGSYVGVKYDDESVEKLVELQDKLGLENRVSPEDLHTTIQYSRNRVPDIEVMEDGGVLKTDGDYELELWGDDEDILVLTFNSESLFNRHHDQMNEYDLTYDYDEYTPHITLSYGIGDQEFDLDSIDLEELGELKVSKEYYEDLMDD